MVTELEDIVVTVVEARNNDEVVTSRVKFLARRSFQRLRHPPLVAAPPPKSQAHPRLTVDNNDCLAATYTVRQPNVSCCGPRRAATSTPRTTCSFTFSTAQPSHSASPNQESPPISVPCSLLGNKSRLLGASSTKHISPTTLALVSPTPETSQVTE